MVSHAKINVTEEFHSGAKVCGQGEWETQKPGEKKHKRWKKLPIGVDDPGQIIAAAEFKGVLQLLFDSCNNAIPNNT